MRAEEEKIHLAPLNFGQIRIDGRLDSLEKGRSLSLTQQQIEILELLGNGMSVREIVEQYYRRGTLVSFGAFKRLLLFLVEEGLIANPSFRLELQKSVSPQASLLQRIKSRIGGPSNEAIDLESELQQMPFFRSLSQGLFRAFLTQCELVSTSAETPICRAGKKSRNLFVLLRGRACVASGQSGERLTTLYPGAVFGEVGFFFGEPRTADVVTDTRSLIGRIRYRSEFDALFKKEQTHELQRRLWMVHALLGSTLFRGIPHDCFDALIFAGTYKTFPTGNWICREGDAGSTCYIIVRGQAEISKQGATIRTLNQGDCFGEVALILTGGRRTASVRAVEDLLVLEISADRFYDLLSRNILLACEFESTAFSRIQADLARA